MTCYSSFVWIDPSFQRLLKSDGTQSHHASDMLCKFNNRLRTSLPCSFAIYRSLGEDTGQISKHGEHLTKCAYFCSNDQQTLFFASRTTPRCGIDTNTSFSMAIQNWRWFYSRAHWILPKTRLSQRNLAAIEAILSGSWCSLWSCAKFSKTYLFPIQLGTETI